MNKKIILVGKGASGKDYFKDFLLSKGFKTSVSHTSRPRREGEIDGKTYHFVTDKEFEHLKKRDVFFEDKLFNGWYYGTSHKEFNSSNVFIFTPGGIASLPKEVIYNSVIVYFDIDESVRYERLLERSDADTIDRRIKSDDDDFKCFINFDIKIIDSNFDCEQLLETIKIYIE